MCSDWFFVTRIIIVRLDTSSRSNSVRVHVCMRIRLYIGRRVVVYRYRSKASGSGQPGELCQTRRRRRLVVTHERHPAIISPSRLLTAFAVVVPHCLRVDDCVRLPNLLVPLLLLLPFYRTLLFCFWSFFH